jgi:ribosomal peptide maturation radical SAM protein 1
MYRIALVNMPFGALHLPSIALTQLKAVVDASASGNVDSQIHYLNHDFVEYFGLDRYLQVSRSVKATVCGLGEWLFQLAAFPNLSDYAVPYLTRYGWMLQSDQEVLADQAVVRRGITAFLDQLIDRHELDEYSLVGFTSMFAQNTASFAMARRLKQRNPNIVTIIGGANCEASMGQVIARHADPIDFVFSGPALKSFPRFVSYLIEGRQEQCHSITGVISKQRLRQSSVATGEIGDEMDINDVVPLDYSGFLDSLGQQCPSIKPSLLFETSRGCWWGQKAHCTFCGLNGTTMRYRAMSPDNATTQFERLFSYSPRASRFESVDNILPKEYVSTVLPRLKPPENASIFYEVKADLREHELQTLAAAGVTEIQPGIESLATSTLKLMKKGTTAFQNLLFLKNCLKYQIRPVWNLLIGFPGEKEDVYQKYDADMKNLLHLPPPSGAFPVRFDRFSPYHMLAKEYGLKLRAYDFYSLIYPFPESEMDELAYFFEDSNYNNSYIAITGAWIGKLEASVKAWNDAWKRRRPDLMPALSFHWLKNAKYVRDTRSGCEVFHELNDQQQFVLEQLGQPASRAGLAQKLGRSESEIAEDIESLQKRGLLFEEDGRFLSLIVDDGRDAGFL